MDIDDIYWSALHDHEADGNGLDSLDARAGAELEALVKTMEQRKAYGEAYRLRFPMENE